MLQCVAVSVYRSLCLDQFASSRVSCVCVAVCCSVLRCVAVCCGVLQCLCIIDFAVINLIFWQMLEKEYEKESV